MSKKNKNINTDNPIIAICYDFDKTLSPKDMQEYSLLPKLKCSATDFWQESNAFAKKERMDKILSYMKLIIEKMTSSKIAITKKDFESMGKSVELYDGVETWFDRINKFASGHNVNVEHYIISAGLKEIIEGTKIKKFIKEVYASSFLYDEYNKPIWIKQVVNYTTKTQYLFRINKDCLDLSDEEEINKYKPNEVRRIPFTNFIYIGDSDTDIPAMKVIKNNGGTSICVYKPDLSDFDKVNDLMTQDRIDFFAPANYSENSKIEELVKQKIMEIKQNKILSDIKNKQNYMIEKLEEFNGFLNCLKEMGEEETDKNLCKKESLSLIGKTKKVFLREFSFIMDEKSIGKIFKKLEEDVKIFYKNVKNK